MLFQNVNFRYSYTWQNTFRLSSPKRDLEKQKLDRRHLPPSVEESRRKIGIVGAGISGLLACKYALSKGFHPLVFEYQATIGGVWTTPLEITRLQTPKHLYQFSDFPWPDSVSDEFPMHNQIIDYIQSYAARFDLVRHVRFNSKVVGIEYTGEEKEEEMDSWHFWGGNGEAFGLKRKWELTVEDTRGQLEVHEVDFVILATGKFSGEPNKPEFAPGKGPEAFSGKVMHSMEYAAMDFESAAAFVKGKRVTVVGLQKSALDIAMECSTANGSKLPCTLVYRRAHWALPDFRPWGVPLLDVSLNRFAELVVHTPDEGWLHSVAVEALSPLRWGFGKLVESYLKWKLPLKKFGMVPKVSFLEEAKSCFPSTLPHKFYDRVEQGSIKLRKSHNIEFCDNGILLDGSSDNSPLIETDVVIFATGFKGEKKVREIFRSPRFRDYMTKFEDASVFLYRQCIHPRIPGVAVMVPATSVSYLYTTEMLCRWVFELLDGSFKLPSIQEMDKEAARWNKFLNKYSSNHDFRCSFVGANLHIWCNDQLCKDMGWNPRRKKGFFPHFFQLHGPSDYASPT